MRSFYIHSLGCAKTRVDSEYVAAMLRARGLHHEETAGRADLLIINTCSFIEDSRIESIDTILEFSEQKQPGQRLMVVGCLPQRYGEELLESLPEVDYFLGTANLDRVGAILDNHTRFESFLPSHSYIPPRPLSRLSSLGAASAYLKVAEGCDRRCAFCAVPLIRGPQQSLSLEHLVDEASYLAQSGVKELNIIAQDLTRWGEDRGEKGRLPQLLEALSEVKGIRWIRLLYLYPAFVTVPLLEAMSSIDAVVPYVDIPVQHFSDRVLKAMNRGYTQAKALKTIEMLRAHVPGIFIRTTILTGHPGEEKSDFDLLRRRIEELTFDHLGVFAYSPEEGTAAFSRDAPSRRSALARQKSIMELQAEISRKKLEELKGKVLPCLVESFDEESMVYIGRHHGQAPEVDGVTYFSDGTFHPGMVADLRITDFSDYDLVASPINTDS
ncbi:30S ribosomal protein S12 methylthiotransferase RimO [Myxococcota bacterium]|nr:30S ribosomal protein S12 methylthiotransferase RimO [Myxococcota bacterium]MBU1534668.1 30S ribosomal protein S12 methylthiotransferase RimO [Myxococcota bacterium]